MKLLSKTISFVFHPLLMGTYGIGLAFVFTYLSIYPSSLKWLIATGTFLSTAVIPGLFILLMIRSGAASDIELSDQRERSVPYLIIITSLMICAYFLHKMTMPLWLIAVIVGSCIALIIALCINFLWKISAHMIGIGALTGGVMAVARIHMLNPSWGFMALFLIAGLLGTSRIFLQKHTPMQVYAGFSLGFVCAFATPLLSYIYLFIK